MRFDCDATGSGDAPWRARGARGEQEEVQDEGRAWLNFCGRCSSSTWGRKGGERREACR